MPVFHDGHSSFSQKGLNFQKINVSISAQAARKITIDFSKSTEMFYKTTQRIYKTTGYFYNLTKIFYKITALFRKIISHL